ncbi:MAG TPA: hypothetical protein VFI72_16310 [Candidatus Angelobacter sp.]|nr:hypothetical protein [Candidatus Angelobacter sp.]
MRILFGLLIVSLAAILVAVGAMWWRIRRHLRSSALVQEAPIQQTELREETPLQPEPERVE